VKTVARFPDLTSAQLAQSMLEAAGIPCSIPDEHSAGLDWRLTGGLGGVRLQVPPEHAEAAVQLLERDAAIDDAELEKLAECGPPLSDRDFCPACGSPSVASAPSRRRAKALTMLFAPALLVAGPLLAADRPKLVCSTCGHVWRPRP
jgi:hypothetical protein